jgi:hypothetical protein
MNRYRISDIKGDNTFRIFLLGHNLSIGTIFEINPSSKYSGLVLLTVMQKKMGLRKEDFQKIEFEPAQ